MKIKLLTLLISLLLFVGICKAQKNKSDAPFFFVQLTDPQFGFIDSNKGFQKEVELGEKMVRVVNKLRPDFVVITGDFVNNSTDSAQIAAFKKMVAGIDPTIPVYLSPGNHDIGHIPDSLNIQTYQKNYGPDRFAFRHKNTLIIGFNTCLIKSNTPNFEEAQYEWLKKQLSKSRKFAHTLLFTHYPFFIQSFDEPETYSNISPAGRKKYLGLFADSHVEAVFSGHLHNNAVANFGKIQFVATSAMGKPLGKAPSGLRIVKVYKDRIEHQYYGLDEVPESVNY